ncbi:MAG TPA: MarR family transcriptional regulator [Candidatus Sulfotelmatobacter sp.]|jgi:MarR family transcriptional regulator for hemolysin|nr:MarR family transcriptional regulator [Candidatus Sulfotelmatobacter sp.]
MTELSPLSRRDFGLSAVRLSRLWRNSVDAELVKFGLTASTWRPLFYLGHLGDGVRPKDLAAALDIEPPSVVQLLDRLEAQGYVERRESAEDRRSKTLHLTDRGRAVQARTMDVSLHMATHLTEGISDDELGICLRVFRRIEQNQRRLAAEDAEAGSTS